MSVSVEFLPGPLTQEMSRDAAERALRQHPAIRKGSAYAMEQLEGRWVAAVVHQAAPPFEGGDPADAGEEAPSPKSEGPDDVEPSEGGESKPPSDDGGEGGPPKKDKGGEKGELHQLMQMMQQICDALGIPVGMGESPVPGLGGPDVPPPAGPPGPPGGPPGMGSPDQVVRHERVTKPGETPPGGTPLGAPAFASVRRDHPWAKVAGEAASFQVAEKIGNMPLNQVRDDLTSLALELPGYRVARLREDRDQDGDRVAVAVITSH